MSFLSPWFLVGLLAVGAPLLAHLRRLSVKKQVEFAAMQFLAPLPPRKARSRWEDVALMAARICALGLLAFAFARPYVRQSGVATATGDGLRKRTVVLLDTSASMRRDGVFEEARAAVRDIGVGLDADDELEVFSFDRSARPVLGPDVWRQTAAAARMGVLEQVLAKAQPSWAATHLDEAVKFVLEARTADRANETVELVLVSDFQEGSHLAKLQGLHWPKNFRVRIVSMSLKRPWQDAAVALQWLPPDAESGGLDAPIRLQVRAGAGFTGELVKLGIEGLPERDWAVPVSAGKKRVISVPGGAFDSGFVHVLGASDFASGVWVAKAPQKRMLVALAWNGDAEDRGGARFYIRRAVEALGESRVEMVTAESLPAERDASVALWISSGIVDADRNPRIAKAIEEGGVALLMMGDAQSGESVGRLLSEKWEVQEASVPDFAVLGEVDRTHRVFAPFKNPQFSDFSGVRFWRHRQVVLPKDTLARVLARFEGGDPALIECRRGKGSVLIWTSDWNPQDAQWALSSRCVPFLAGCLEMTAGGRAPLLAAAPGEPLLLPEGTTGLRAADGTLFPRGEGRTVLDVPGVYAIEPGGGIVVVNVSGVESRLAPLPAEKFESLGVPVHKDAALGGVVPLQAARNSLVLVAAEIEARQGGWRWLLAAVLVLLGVETWWAARLPSREKGRM